MSTVLRTHTHTHTHTHKERHKKKKRERGTGNSNCFCELVKPHLKWQYSHMWMKVNVLWIWPISEELLCWWRSPRKKNHRTEISMLLSLSSSQVLPFIYFSLVEDFIPKFLPRTWQDTVWQASKMLDIYYVVTHAHLSCLSHWSVFVASLSQLNLYSTVARCVLV